MHISSRQLTHEFYIHIPRFLLHTGYECALGKTTTVESYSKRQQTCSPVFIINVSIAEEGRETSQYSYPCPALSLLHITGLPVATSEEHSVYLTCLEYPQWTCIPDSSAASGTVLQLCNIKYFSSGSGARCKEIFTSCGIRQVLCPTSPALEGSEQFEPFNPHTGVGSNRYLALGYRALVL